MPFRIVSERSLRATPRRLAVIAALLFCPVVKSALAQTAPDLPNAPSFASLLPDAPPPDPPSSQDLSSPARSGVTANTPPATPLPEASRTQRHIQPGQAAPQLAPSDKFAMGLKGIVSPFSGVGWLAAAGYEQLTNSSPNWGTDRGAFGERLGSAAIRATTEGFLSNGVMASLLHEDPRYYRLGRGHNPLSRTVYAATRPIITRTDSGRTMPNFALMGGNLAGSALTNLYYPQMNRGVEQTLATFGSGLAGSAVGNGIAEFFGGFLFDRHH